MVAILAEPLRLVEVAELPVEHPQAWTGDAGPRLRQQGGQQTDVVGLAVGVGRQRHGQPLARQVSDQQLATVDLAEQAAQLQQPLGHPLDLLAVDHYDRQAVQAGWQGGDDGPGRQQPPQLRGELVEEAQRQGQGQATELAVDGADAGV